MSRLLLGYPLIKTSCGSVTLDYDEVIIDKDRLRKRKNWFEPDIIKEYESAFGRCNGSKYAFAFMGGRMVLSACIQALNLKSNDGVLLLGYTCVVVPNAFCLVGVKIVYCDIELDAYGSDASLIEEKITPRTKAILLHHL